MAEGVRPPGRGPAERRARFRVVRLAIARPAATTRISLVAAGNIRGDAPVRRRRDLASADEPSTSISPRRLSDGRRRRLHVDTNNGRPFRFVTALCYLNDVGDACGGETLFPTARSVEDETCHDEALFGDGRTHTTGGGTRATDRLLELGREASNGTRGLAVKPTKGLLVVFYSRTRAGRIDATSWHGGCAVDPSSPGKWTLQKFFEARRRRPDIPIAASCLALGSNARLVAETDVSARLSRRRPRSLSSDVSPWRRPRGGAATCPRRRPPPRREPK